MKKRSLAFPLLSGDRRMLGAYAAALIALAAAIPDAAHAAEPLVRFDGGIGSQPLRAGGLVNDVQGVPPGGRPWVIADLKADVRTNGAVNVDGRGLLLAGGLIGSTAAQSVRARLICGTQTFDSELVKLAPNGDFRIRGFLSAVPPNPCTNGVDNNGDPIPAILLIINGGGNWFAAGIPK